MWNGASNTGANTTSQKHSIGTLLSGCDGRVPITRPAKNTRAAGIAPLAANCGSLSASGSLASNKLGFGLKFRASSVSGFGFDFTSPVAAAMPNIAEPTITARSMNILLCV